MPDRQHEEKGSAGPRTAVLARPWLFRRETLSFGLVAVLAIAAGAALYGLQPTIVTVAVAPRDGTEPALFDAFAAALAAAHENVRLKIQLYDDVRDSAAALQDGRADLAVVRPDVALPSDGLTLAVLRDQAMIVASPATGGIKTFPDLAGKRLGILARHEDDVSLLKTLLGYYALAPQAGDAAGAVPRDGVRLVPLEEGEVASAFKARRIDAIVSIIAPSAPRAIALVAAVQSTSRTGRLAFAAVEDDDAIIERFPLLQAVTVQSGLFGGRPKVPEDDIKTIGASYRLMARASLNRTLAASVTQHLFEMRSDLARTTVAADYVAAPSYDTTVAATSARLPNHPGAIDYYEREQRGFVDRYGDLAYLAALLCGGAGSVWAWLRQRLSRLRRERIDEITDRLLDIVAEADVGADPATIEALGREIDRLAADAVRCAREREPPDRTMTAVAIAVGTARAATSARTGPPRASSAPPTPF